MQVIVLRALQSRLLEALSKVHNGAAQLAVLRRLEKEALPEVAAAGSEPSEGERQRLLSGAKRATRKCIESILSVRPRFARCLKPCRYDQDYRLSNNSSADDALASGSPPAHGMRE